MANQRMRPLRGIEKQGRETGLNEEPCRYLQEEHSKKKEQQVPRS